LHAATVVGFGTVVVVDATAVVVVVLGRVVVGLGRVVVVCGTVVVVVGAVVVVIGAVVVVVAAVVVVVGAVVVVVGAVVVVVAAVVVVVAAVVVVVGAVVVVVAAVVVVVGAVVVVVAPVASGSVISKNAWSAVTNELFDDTRMRQLRKSGNPLPGDGSFGERQLNSDCGLSPLNGVISCWPVNVAVPSIATIVGAGEEPRSQSMVTFQFGEAGSTPSHCSAKICEPAV
jgi:hypothetical protein